MRTTPSSSRSQHETTHWQGIYQATLENLRITWPHAWPGLPVVLQSCIRRLWSNHPPPFGSTSWQMLFVAASMAAHMESLACVANDEPKYHNRLHTADALTAICLLIQALKEKHLVVSDEWTAALLLAVTSHDVLHPGGANGFLQEFEQRSANELKKLASNNKVEGDWLHNVIEMVLRTDPTLVPGNHDRVKGTAFEMNLDWACVLINEADILASASPFQGPGLGQALAQEWALKNHPLHKVVGTPAGRLHFLSSLRFSTPASEAFQIAQSVQHQIEALQHA
jgi:hypothetical protein